MYSIKLLLFLHHNGISSYIQELPFFTLLFPDSLSWYSPQYGLKKHGETQFKCTALKQVSGQIQA